MATEDFQRIFTAVFSADVAGYSRLMGENEEARVRTLTAYWELMVTSFKSTEAGWCIHRVTICLQCFRRNVLPFSVKEERLLAFYSGISCLLFF
jgi:hypothetical protein